MNTAMRKALQLAIGAGFEFVKADFENLSKFRSGYWIGDSDEWVYSMAIAEGNYSAAVAFEQWKGREPIIADNVDPGERHSSYAHMSGKRAKERLHVGCHFEWHGEKVKVTSFTDKGDAVACVYHPAEGEYGRESKIKKRYTVTRELVIQERAERKQRAAIVEELISLKLNGEKCRSAFGVTTMKEVEAMPFKKFVKIAESLKKGV